MLRLLLALFLAFAVPPRAGTEPGLHAPYDALLRAHVKDGWVDYRALKEKEKELDGYLADLSRTDPSLLPREGQLALWINAYNAFTLKLILEHYPGIKSIKDVPRRWDQRRYVVGGKTWSLGQIEHEVLRKQLLEPRSHFALVCASRSCPDLLSEAYVPERLEEQLSGAARRFLSNGKKGFAARREPGFFFGENNNVYLSRIFDWFSEDFERPGGSVIGYLTPYLPQDGKRFVEEHQGDLSIRYLDYDWSLNGLP